MHLRQPLASTHIKPIYFTIQLPILQVFLFRHNIEIYLFLHYIFMQFLIFLKHLIAIVAIRTSRGLLISYLTFIILFSYMVIQKTVFVK